MLADSSLSLSGDFCNQNVEPCAKRCSYSSLFRTPENSHYVIDTAVGVPPQSSKGRRSCYDYYYKGEACFKHRST